MTGLWNVAVGVFHFHSTEHWYVTSHHAGKGGLRCSVGLGSGLCAGALNYSRCHAGTGFGSSPQFQWRLNVMLEPAMTFYTKCMLSTLWQQFGKGLYMDVSQGSIKSVHIVKKDRQTWVQMRKLTIRNHESENQTMFGAITMWSYITYQREDHYLPRTICLDVWVGQLSQFIYLHIDIIRHIHL